MAGVDQISSSAALVAVPTSLASPSPSSAEQLRGGKKVKVIAAEPAACPSLTRGKYAYDFGDTSAHDTAGENAHAGFHCLHAAGLPCRWPALPRHGTIGVRYLKELGLIEAEAYTQNACFEAGVLFAKTEGIVPAPEVKPRREKAPSTRPSKAKRDGHQPHNPLRPLRPRPLRHASLYGLRIGCALEDKSYDEAMLAASLADLPRIAAE